MGQRANYYHLNRPAVEALMAVSQHITSIEPRLKSLVELRASQINGCVYCVDMHSNEARKAGETQQRLDCICVWRESALFSEPERAALGWAESLTNVSRTRAADEDYAALEPHFSEQQIVDLTFIVATINAWNRIAIGHRKQPPKR